MQYTIPKGVYDILPHDPKQENQWRLSNRWYYIETVIRSIAKNYAYREIRTPIFESAALFQRGIGESSDIVSKEMYIFEDKAKRLLALRPEGTAPVMRAFIEKRLDLESPPYKYFYFGPMFRYERPQAGRYRQHYQFGVESIGDASVEQDAEIIEMLCHIYQKLGLKQLNVLINSIGDSASRENYREALRSYLKPYFADLSKDSQERFTKNVLRILDSKDVKDREILKEAPKITDFLSAEARMRFERLQSLLSKQDIAFTIAPELVRGLDYYNQTVFEITSGELGAQNSLGGGGRFDGLLSELGGTDLPACGFATGLERLLQTMDKQGAAFPATPAPFISLIPLGDSARNFCFDLTYKLRHLLIPAECDYQSKKVGKALQRSVSSGADFCLVLGEEELKSCSAELKNLKTRELMKVPLDQLADKIHQLYNESSKQ